MRQPQLTARRRGAIVVTLLIVGVSIGACSSDNGDSAGRSGLAGANASGGDLAVASLQQGFESVVQRVRPSVVEISTDGGLGSGVVYDENVEASRSMSVSLPSAVGLHHDVVGDPLHTRQPLTAARPSTSRCTSRPGQGDDAIDDGHADPRASSGPR
ncbi:MAG: hypothetical protein QOG43_1934 [Actinomycetota bacterium]|nr:hypothetical protein [Actinomycetota bacterium]